MSAVSFADDLVRDYLLYRGFMGTLKAFDAEIKADKDKGFRPDHIVEHLSYCISSMDLTALRDAWSHLDHRLFSHLEQSFLKAAGKLETALFRMYLVTCVSNGRHDKLLEFFERLTPELQGMPEWKDWFALPFLKCPEDNPPFQVYFTRQWQDTMLVSLHNFLSVIFQSMALPMLLTYDDEVSKLNMLQEENTVLKQQLAGLMSERFDGGRALDGSSNQTVPGPPEIMDDFYCIAQEAPLVEMQGKSFKSLIRNFGSGLPTSPILGRRQQGGNGSKKPPADYGSGLRPVSAVKPKPRAPSAPPHGASCAPMPALPLVAKVLPQPEPEANRKAHVKMEEVNAQHYLLEGVVKTRSASASRMPVAEMASRGSDQKGCFLMLSQEEYTEHRSCITHCKFNSSGSMVASSDLDGVIKVWSSSPSIRTQATLVSKSSVLSLEWASKRERLLLYGNKTGTLRLFDTKERKNVCDVGADSGSLLKDQRILCLACSPTEAHFVCSTSSALSRQSRTEMPSSPVGGRLLLWDMRSFQLERPLQIQPDSAVANCCVFNHNGQILVTGTTDGRVCLFDMRTFESIATWEGHRGEVYSVQFSRDETACYTMGSDGKFVQWSINRTGEKMAELVLHPGAAGPFPTSGQNSGYRRHHRPVGQLFAFDVDGSHVLTCGPTGGIVYKVVSGGGPAVPLLSLAGHRRPVITVDWSTTVESGICITGSVDGSLMASTLLSQ